MIQLIIQPNSYSLDPYLHEINEDVLIVPDKLFILALDPNNQKIRNNLFAMRPKKHSSFVRITRLGHKLNDGFYQKDLNVDPNELLMLNSNERSLGIYEK